jgi:hypothetical protein
MPDVALVEYMNGYSGADQFGRDIGLQVGKREHQIRLQRQDFWNVCRNKRGHPRLFAADPWRPHRIAGDADNAIPFTEQIQRLDGLFRETYDSAGRELAHAG